MTIQVYHSKDSDEVSNFKLFRLNNTVEFKKKMNADAKSGENFQQHLVLSGGWESRKTKGCQNENTMSSPNTKCMIIFQNKSLTHGDVSS